MSGSTTYASGVGMTQAVRPIEAEEGVSGDASMDHEELNVNNEAEHKKTKGTSEYDLFSLSA